MLSDFKEEKMSDRFWVFYGGLSNVEYAVEDHDDVVATAIVADAEMDEQHPQTILVDDFGF